jgi:tetratricopeptide (TPR) repeat protein
LSYGKNLSYHPFIEIIKTLAKIKEEDSQLQSIEKIEKLLEEYDPANQKKSLPFLAKFLGLQIPDEYRNEILGIEGEILAKMITVHLKTLFSRISNTAPLVIIFEDFHWVDSSSIKLLKSMFTLVRNNRIVFIIIFRPGYEDTGISIQTFLNEQFPEDNIEIELFHLDASNSDELIYGLLRTTGIPPAIREQIRIRSEGNPFFIEEILRSFIDEGIIEVQNGEFTITPAIDNVVIPHTIQELLMARIDRLDGNLKSLVKTASVIGRNFFQKIIVEVAEPINNILGKLEYLKEVQFIKEAVRKDEIEYLFKHALLQKSAYESILIQKRKELHHQVAEAIERVFEEKLADFFGMLAYHFSNAEDLEKAEEYMLKAGEEALKSSASGEAIQYFSDALKYYRKIHGGNANPDKIMMMNRNLALACLYWGNQRDAVHYLEEVLRHYGFRFDYKPYRYMLFFLQCIFLLYFPIFAWKKAPENKDYEIADLFMLRSNILATSIPERMIENFLLFKWLTKFNPLKFNVGADMFSMLSVMSSYGGISFRLSKKTLEHINDKITDKTLLKTVYNEFANRMHNFLCGEWRKIKPYNPEIPPLYIKNDKYMYASFYQNMYQLFYTERGDHQMAADISNDMLQINEKYGYKGIAEASTSKVYFKFRKLTDARKMADKAISQSARLGESQYLFSAYCIKARILIHRGNFPGSENMLTKANEAASDIVPMYKTDYDTAKQLYDVAILEQSIQSRSKSPDSVLVKNASNSCNSAIRNCRMVALDRVEIYKLTGIYHWLLGRQKKALRWWRKSIVAGKYMGANLELSRTYFEVGKRLSEPNSRFTSLNDIAASEYLSMARKMFEEMDLSWDLKRMEKS